VTLGYALVTLGAVFMYTAIKNMSLLDIVQGRTGPGQPADISPELQAGIGTGAKTNGGGGGGIDVSGGGGWGGSEKIAKALAKGMPHGSQKRSTRSTASGNVSDHWEGCKACYAIDIPASGTTGNRYADKILKRAGAGGYSGGALSKDVTFHGYRVQVLWQVADHYDHVHLGVRKLGYTP